MSHLLAAARPDGGKDEGSYLPPAREGFVSRNDAWRKSEVLFANRVPVIPTHRTGMNKSYTSKIV